MSHKFQIDLLGIIELLSEHLYSSPQVYLRELLQNGVDAMQARESFNNDFQPKIKVSVSNGENGRLNLLFEDNGIGLTEDEIHKFLSTIGKSSKRGLENIYETDFIGQFGIGLLSCFVVSEVVCVKTLSAKPGSQPIEWNGRDDGTYSIKILEEEISVGTQVFLQCKTGFETYFETEFIKSSLKNFGGLLKFPIIFSEGENELQINVEVPPWREEFYTSQEEKEAFLKYGREMFGIEFLDYIRLDEEDNEVSGVAFVLPFSPNLASKKTHRVYLKNMLLSENAEGLLPEWAFFVKSIVNVNNLRPTASRESFYEDGKLLLTRNLFGAKLRSYLLDLAKNEPNKLRKIIEIHYLSIKALAIDDDEFYRMFIDWMPFETTLGWMSLDEYKKLNQRIAFIRSRDQFRQISQVAASQNICVINASYTYDAELLYKHYDLNPEIPVEEVTPSSFSREFSFLTLDEQEETAQFMRKADEVLRSFQCVSDMKRFSPTELPVVLLADEEAGFQRSIEQTKQVTSELWSGILDNMSLHGAEDNSSQLCFNFSNPLIAKISRSNDDYLQKLAIQILYVQSLLLSHRPLNSKEMKMFNESLLGMLEFSIDIGGDWIQ